LYTGPNPPCPSLFFSEKLSVAAAMKLNVNNGSSALFPSKPKSADTENSVDKSVLLVGSMIGNSAMLLAEAEETVDKMEKKR